MHPYIEQLSRLVKEYDTSGENEGNILDFLVRCYSDEHPVSNEKITAIEERLAPYFESIDFEQSSNLFLLVYDLCSNYQEAAFRTGLQVGMQLCGDIIKIGR